MEALAASEETQKTFDIYKKVFDGAIHAADKAKEMDMQTFDSMMNNVYENLFTNPDNSYLKITYSQIPKLDNGEIDIGIRKAIGKFYDVTLRQADATIKTLTKDFKIADVNTFEDFAAKIFNSPLEAKKLRGQLTMKYEK